MHFPFFPFENNWMDGHMIPISLKISSKQRRKMCFFIYSEQLNFYIYKTFEVVMGSGNKIWVSVGFRNHTQCYLGLGFANLNKYYITILDAFGYSSKTWVPKKLGFFHQRVSDFLVFTFRTHHYLKAKQYISTYIELTGKSFLKYWC